jgi:hypothetical protein
MLHLRNSTAQPSAEQVSNKLTDQAPFMVIFGNQPASKLAIHSPLPLTLYLASPRVPALFRIFRYSFPLFLEVSAGFADLEPRIRFCQ